MITMADSIDSLVARIAFSKIKGINHSTATRLLGIVGSPENYFTLSPTALAASTGIDSKVCDDKYRQNLLENARTEADFIRQKNIAARFVASDTYPRRLNECDDAPALLYSIGQANLDSLHTISVVGTRHATPYGLDFVRHLIADVASSLDSLVVISGLAYGIDVAAHRAALDNGVPTVAVVAHGLNTIYPADHRSTAARIVSEGGAILTEYPSDAAIHKGNFLARNRIVAGLADAVIVVESDTKGGAMSTARIANAYNREVMAVPGRTTDTYSRGCNELIAQQTATIIRSADDLIETLNWTARPAEATQQTIGFELTPEQKTVADYIVSHPDHTVNDICVALGMPYNRLSAMLFEMEMNDMLITLPGGRFAVTNY